MQHTAVVAGLMTGGTTFLFENDDFHAWITANDLVCGRKTNNSRTDYSDFHGVPCGCARLRARRIWTAAKDSFISPASHHTFALQSYLREGEMETSQRTPQTRVLLKSTSGTPEILRRFSCWNIPSRTSPRPFANHHFRKYSCLTRWLGTM